MEQAILEFGTFFAGLVICLVHRRMSRWMWLVIASLAVGLCFSMWQVNLATQNLCFPPSIPRPFFAACWAVFFTGLSKVLSDTRRQIEALKFGDFVAAFDELDHADKRNAHEPAAELVAEMQAKPELDFEHACVE